MIEGATAPLSRDHGQPGREGIRLAIAYFAFFSTVGIQLPYWPVWLAYRGMGPGQIGVLLGVTTWARLASPWVGNWADRRGNGERVASALAAATLASVIAFGWTEGFVPLLLLSIASGLVVAPILSLIEGISVTAAASGRLDYGRVRLWGSAAFVLASSLVGFALQGRSPSLVLHILVGASAALFAATLFLPRAAPHGHPARQVRQVAEVSIGGARATGTRPPMATFLAAAACVQGSHAVRYTFGTRHWQAIGISESTIGWLWAWGVIAEVALFAVGGGLVARFRPAGLIVAAALAGVVRWPLLAWVESVPVIVAVQTLHAATFAATHLGAMSWIRDTIDRAAVQRTTALYAAITNGAALGLGMPLAGALYARFAGEAYHAMAIACGVGLLFALRLYRHRPAHRD